MSMDKSLRMRRGLVGSRSVLSRVERIMQLKDQDRFDPEADSPLHLPKVRVYKLSLKKKKKVKGPEEDGDDKKKKKK